MKTKAKKNESKVHATKELREDDLEENSYQQVN